MEISRNILHGKVERCSFSLLLLIFAAVIVACFAFSLAVVCYAEELSGNSFPVHGGSIQWSFDESSKTLAISGNGDMPDWDKNEDVPWYKLNREASRIVVQNGITKIGSYAFWGAGEYSDHGARIYISEGVVEISDHALTSSCVNAIYVDSSNPTYCSIQGALFDKSGVTLLHAPGSRSGRYIVPDGTTGIGDWAFEWCCYIQEIVFPSGVKEIGDYAFSSCHALTSVIFPDGLQSIGNHIFNSSSMYACRPVLGIPASVKYIGADLFDRRKRPENMSELEVYYAGTEEEWRNIDFATPEDVSGFYTIYFLREGYGASVSNNPGLAYGGRWVSGQRSEQTNYYEEELTIRYTGNNTFVFTWLKPWSASLTDLSAVINLDSGIAVFDNSLYYVANQGAGTITLGDNAITLHISLSSQDSVPGGYEVTFTDRESDQLHSAAWFT